MSLTLPHEPSTAEAAPLLEALAARGEAIDAALIHEVFRLSGTVDPRLIRAHFLQVRQIARYVRDFSPGQIALHLQLLAQVDDSQLVTLELRPSQRDAAWELTVAGVDMVGVSACVTGCLAELSLSITQLEVTTYSSDVRGDVGAGLVLGSRYVMTVRVLPPEQRASLEELTAKLRTRLKAAYWHLVRGDVVSARLETDDDDPLLGVVLDGKFRIERPLGRGGMGAIYLAAQLDLDRLVAVKIIRPEHAGQREFIDLFRAEARMLAQTRSPHVVQVYAAGVHENQCWMALEYLSGGDVAHWIERRGLPDGLRAARWLRDALTGLHYIHAQVGLLHGDLKPSNLLLDAGEHLKIGDLGLGQLCQKPAGGGEGGAIRGTPWYMAPEQARGERLDFRSDLFSLGSTFFHILSGLRPFESATAAEVLHRVARGAQPPLEELAPYVPPPLAVIVGRLMQPEPLRRYQSAEVALADLQSYVENGLLVPDQAGVVRAPQPHGETVSFARERGGSSGSGAVV